VGYHARIGGQLQIISEIFVFTSPALPQVRESENRLKDENKKEHSIQMARPRAWLKKPVFIHSHTRTRALVNNFAINPSVKASVIFP